MKKMWKTLLSPELRSFIEKQIETLEKLSDSLSEFQDEYYELKKAYEENLLESLTIYCNEYGIFELPKVKKEKKESLFFVEPIRKGGKISLDSYWIRCLTYYRDEKKDFFISERVYNLQELKRLVKCQVFDAEDYNEALKAYELLEWKQDGRH